MHNRRRLSAGEGKQSHPILPTLVQAFKKGTGGVLPDVYWQRCVTHLSANLLKHASARLHDLNALLKNVDDVIAFHRATAARKTALATCADQTNCQAVVLKKV
jgi:transposase-like protein